ncbi:MAG: hypothetical protein WD341_09870 [Tistlia sp.]|uniref:hypothetical protein n=1 Tax=Tistlia sp. TaxID=3057121 RepID=UPI0034A106F9
MTSADPLRPVAPTGSPAAPAAASAPRAGGLGLRGLALAVTVASLALGAAAMALASHAAFERALLTTVDSRLSEVATEVARHVENGLQAGVALEQQRRLLAVMADERSQVPDLSAIRVLDDRGRILFSTNEAEIGEKAGTAVPGAGGLPGAPPWRQVGAVAITYGLPMTGLFGESLGTVTVALPTAAVADQRERFALALALGAVAITLAGGLLAALLLVLLPLPATARLQRLRQRLDALDLATGEARPELPAVSPKERGPALAGALRRFEAWLGPRLADLGEREAEVRRLDETA